MVPLFSVRYTYNNKEQVNSYPVPKQWLEILYIMSKTTTSVTVKNVQRTSKGIEILRVCLKNPATLSTHKLYFPPTKRQRTPTNTTTRRKETPKGSVRRYICSADLSINRLRYSNLIPVKLEISLAKHRL